MSTLISSPEPAIFLACSFGTCSECRAEALWCRGQRLPDLSSQRKRGKRGGNGEIGKSRSRKGRREAGKGDSFASLLSFSFPSDPLALEYSLPRLCLLNCPLSRLCSLYFDYRKKPPYWVPCDGLASHRRGSSNDASSRFMLSTRV